MNNTKEAQKKYDMFEAYELQQYLNAYQTDGIEFNMGEERTLTYTQQTIDYLLAKGKIDEQGAKNLAHMVGTKKTEWIYNNNPEPEMIEKFYARRWKEREPLCINEIEFINEELQTLSKWEYYINEIHPNKLRPLLRYFHDRKRTLETTPTTANNTTAMDIQQPEEKNRDFTTARQVIAIYYLLEECGIKNHEIDRKAKADLAHFLTGKNHKNLYDAFQEPFFTKEKHFRFNDLKYVRQYFENLGLSEIVKKINKQIEPGK